MYLYTNMVIKPSSDGWQLCQAMDIAFKETSCRWISPGTGSYMFPDSLMGMRTCTRGWNTFVPVPLTFTCTNIFIFHLIYYQLYIFLPVTLHFRNLVSIFSKNFTVFHHFLSTLRISLKELTGCLLPASIITLRLSYLII